jgi:hypothetical protein
MTILTQQGVNVSRPSSYSPTAAWMNIGAIDVARLFGKIKAKGEKETGSIFSAMKSIVEFIAPTPYDSRR